MDHLGWLSIDELWSLGDICDRGPDSGACYDVVRSCFTGAVMGNHDEVILKAWDRFYKTGVEHPNPEKVRTMQTMNPSHVEYIRTLPKLHVFDDAKLALVHAGLYPKIPLYAQPDNIIRTQMIHPDYPGKSRWWGQESNLGPDKKSEEENRAEGWKRWYELYDYDYDVIYGHSVFGQPFVHQNPGCGTTIGIDTGSCFGGALTACIYSNIKPLLFITVKAKKIYATDIKRSWWEK